MGFDTLAEEKSRIHLKSQLTLCKSQWVTVCDFCVGVSNSVPPAFKKFFHRAGKMFLCFCGSAARHRPIREWPTSTVGGEEQQLRLGLGLGQEPTSAQALLTGCRRPSLLTHSLASNKAALKLHRTLHCASRSSKLQPLRRRQG